MERLHLDKRDYDPHMLTWVEFVVTDSDVRVGDQIVKGGPRDSKGRGIRARVCPKHRIRLLAAIAKTKTGRVVDEKPAKGGVCSSCRNEKAKRRKR